MPAILMKNLKSLRRLDIRRTLITFVVRTLSFNIENSINYLIELIFLLIAWGHLRTR